MGVTVSPSPDSRSGPKARLLHSKNGCLPPLPQSWEQEAGGRIDLLAVAQVLRYSTLGVALPSL